MNNKNKGKILYPTLTKLFSNIEQADGKNVVRKTGVELDEVDFSNLALQKSLLEISKQIMNNSSNTGSSETPQQSDGSDTNKIDRNFMEPFKSIILV